MINVVANIAWMNFPVSWSADAKPLVSGMKQVTIEALLRSADWTDGRGDALSSVFGIEGNFLVRIGDAPTVRATSSSWPRDRPTAATGPQLMPLRGFRSTSGCISPWFGTP